MPVIMLVHIMHYTVRAHCRALQSLPSRDVLSMTIRRHTST